MTPPSPPAPPPFCGTVPPDRLYCPRTDMWLRLESDGRVRLGATAFGIHLAGELLAFTGKPRGADITRGRGMGTVECRKTVIALHAPISFVLEAINESAEENPALINRTPYAAGWMMLGRPTRWEEESGELIDAKSYCQHILCIEPQAAID